MAEITESPCAVPPSSPPHEAKGAKRWYVGTLSYSVGGLVALFFWLLWGDFGHFLKERGVPQAVQLLMGKFEVPDVAVGLLLGSLPWAIAIFVVPMVGYRSDRYRSRWGRRIPFLVVPTIGTFVAVVGLALSREIGEFLHRALGGWSPGQHTAVVLSLVVSWTLFEFFAIICNSVFLSLIPDVVPREVIGRFFALFRVMSLVAGIVFNYYLFGFIEDHYAAVVIGIGVVYFVSFMAMCLKVKEGQYPPPPPEPPPAPVVQRFAMNIKSYLRDCFREPFYRCVYVSLAFGYMAAVPPSLFSVLYAHSLGMSMADFGKYGAIQLCVSLLQAYPVGWLVDRFHAMRVMLVAQVLVIVSTAAAFWWVRDASQFGIAIVVAGTLAGFYGNAIAALPAQLFPKEKFATYDSARQVSIALGGIIISPIGGLALDFLGHDYRFMYLFASMLALVAFGASVLAYRRFRFLGGPRAYVAPQ
jgi:MFS family permease